MLPELSEWAQQLANVLPFTILLDVLDTSTQLHVFELSGFTPLWSWALTPKAARLLLSKSDRNGTCSLDRADNCGKSLECIDGRYGDHYPSSAPTTVRLAVAGLPSPHTVANASDNLANGPARLQQLDLIHLSHAPAAPSAVSPLLALLRCPSPRYALVSLLGWALWTLLLRLALLHALPLAAFYLLLMPTTGLLATLLHSGAPRTLGAPRATSHARLVVAADTLNASDWLAFHGPSPLVNALLNRPLARPPSALATSALLRAAVAASIAAQWVLLVLCAAHRGWDALVVAAWAAWCALAAAALYAPVDAVRDWLRATCGVRVVRAARADFSARTAMLGALVAVSPEESRGGEHVEWIDPVLRDGAARREWLGALLEVLETGDCADEGVKGKFVWNWVKEGVEVGRELRGVVEGLGKEGRRVKDE